MHKTTVIGNVGSDPEMRYTPSGQGVTQFSLASNRKYKTADGEQKEETTWFRVSAWGRLAEVCNQYLTKGKQVYVEGRIAVRDYQASDGTTRFSIDLTANEVQFLGGNAGSGSAVNAPAGNDADDLPF